MGLSGAVQGLARPWAGAWRQATPRQPREATTARWMRTPAAQLHPHAHPEHRGAPPRHLSPSSAIGSASCARGYESWYEGWPGPPPLENQALALKPILQVPDWMQRWR